MAQTKVKLISDGVIVQGNLHASHGITTAHIGEGSNLYYTDARVGSYLSTNSFATESYVGTQITNLVDSSPATLNTLNELAAALGDDPNFATTTANSIGLKAPLAGPSFTGNATFAGDIGIGISPGENLHIFKSDATALIQASNTSGIAQLQFFPRDSSNVAHLQSIKGVDSSLTFLTGGNSANSYVPTERMRISSTGATFTGNITAKVGNFQAPDATASIINQFACADGSNAATFRTTTSGKIFEIRSQNSGTIKIDSTNTTFTGGVTGTIAKFDTLNNNANSANIIYRSGTDTIVGGGSPPNKIYIQDGGNVGIGMTSPSQKLDIAGDVRIQDGRSLFFKRHGDNYAWRMRNESAANGSTYGFDGSNDLVFEVVSNSAADNLPAVASHSVYSTSANTLVLRETGLVGIGTPSPEQRLHVEGRGIFDSGGSSDILQIRNDNGGGVFGMTSNLFSLDLASTSNFRIRQGSTTPLYIKNDGNVGISNTSPDEKLEISGTGSVYPNIKFSFPGVTSRYMRIGMVSAVKYEFEVNGAGTYMVFKTEGVERMQINSTYVKIAAGKQLRMGDYFHIGPGDSSYMGTLGFNRDTSNGDIFNSSYGAYQMHNYQGELKLQVYSAAGGTIGEHKFFNNGKVSFFNNVGVGLTSSPLAKLDARGAIMTGYAAEDGNFSSTTATGMSNTESGSLQITQGWVGSGSNGDTIVFRYNATVWKSWGLEWNFMSTNGMSSGFIGGYNNNSTGHSKVTNNNAHGVTVSYANSSQNNIITFTFTALGTHPMASFKYYQSGGDGRPYPSKTSITLNS